MATIRGGEKLEAALKEISKRVSKKALLRVGFLENATYPNGQQVAEVAAFNEYGVPSHNQPPRPFFRNMIAAKEHEWAPALGMALKANDYDVDKSLDLIGTGIEGQLRASIIELVSPPLAPSTIARKGKSKPLIDTGHMLNSVDHDIKE
jgi:hypothetical protein